LHRGTPCWQAQQVPDDNKALFTYAIRLGPALIRQTPLTMPASKLIFNSSISFKLQDFLFDFVFDG
jgi:hypothetical protein